MEYAPMPALMVEGKLWFAASPGYDVGGYKLFVGDLVLGRDSLVKDSVLVDTINCLAQNSH